MLAFVDGQHAVHQHVVDAFRVRFRLLERVRLADRRRVEDDDVGRKALAELPAIPQPENLRPQRLRASVTLSSVATIFTLFVMRRDVLIVGEESRPFSEDLMRLPALIGAFLLAPLSWMMKAAGR